MTHPKSKIEHGKILIAEDDLINQRLLSYQLKELQDNLIFACNGKEAFDLFKENNNVSLVLMDIQMPGMNGVEATQKILEYDPKAKVIGLSAYPKEECRFDVEIVDFVDYVTKPVNKNELVKVIFQHLT
ncbi:response regulator [Maribellus mangrovi]|uniref:response regulator n=1 Tax=Maribellus mangrovi TaxID=3133146 RepID=UPI0030ED24CB